MNILVFSMILGLIPAYIANKKGHNFIEWWIFGTLLIFVALPWSILMKTDENLIALEKGLKKCPRCAEWVKMEAKVCRYCNAELGESNGLMASKTKKNYCPKCKKVIDNNWLDNWLGECPDCESFLTTIENNTEKPA